MDRAGISEWFDGSHYNEEGLIWHGIAEHTHVVMMAASM